MNILIGCFQQESNTLSSRLSVKDDFSIYRGTLMLDHIHIKDYLESEGAAVIPTLYAHALPGGALERESYEAIAHELVDMLAAGVDKADGIWLYLHGALYVNDLGSGELELMKLIRQVVGYTIPIALALDFHANNTTELMQYVNIIVGYRTAPHRDMEETELRTAQLLVHCIRRGLLPEPQIVRVPVVVPGDCVLTDEQPMRTIMEKARDLEQQPGMLVCNVFNGQPWVDAPFMGPTMICVHESNPEASKRASRELGKLFFSSRHAFTFTIEAEEPEQALLKAYAAEEVERPVFITDSGDNTTAGAVGDNAYLLNRILQLQLKKVLVAGITDAPAVAHCEALQIGDQVDLTVGATLEPQSTQAMISGKILYTGDIEGWYGENAGRCAVVRVGTVDVVLTARRCALTRLEIFQGIGVNPADYTFTVVKLGYLFPNLAQIAGRTILAFTKGTSTERLADMGFSSIKRPIYPLDDDFEPVL